MSGNIRAPTKRFVNKNSLEKLSSKLNLHTIHRPSLNDDFKLISLNRRRAKKGKHIFVFKTRAKQTPP